MDFKLRRLISIGSAAAALFALAGCAGYPYQDGYGYSQSTTTYSQPMYPGGGYAPPSGYYESRQYVQPAYPQPYGYAPGYAPGYSNGGIVIFGGSGGRRYEDYNRDHRHDGRGDDEHRRGDGGWHGGQGHDGEHHRDPRMNPDEHGRDHGPQRQAPPGPAAAPPSQPQAGVQSPRPVQPHAPGPRRDRD